MTRQIALNNADNWIRRGIHEACGELDLADIPRDEWEKILTTIFRDAVEEEICDYE